MHIRKYRGISPSISADAFIMPGCVISGDVTIGPQASVWYNATIRADVGKVTIGARSNIQECAVVHESEGRTPTLIEEDVTIGHGAIVHGAVIRRGSLIGMGAIVLDDAEIGPESLVGAGALVREGTVIPEGHLAVGVPAKVVRPLTEQERRSLRESAVHYVQYAAEHCRDDQDSE